MPHAVSNVSFSFCDHAASAHCFEGAQGDEACLSAASSSLVADSHAGRTQIPERMIGRQGTADSQSCLSGCDRLWHQKGEAQSKLSPKISRLHRITGVC